MTKRTKETWIVSACVKSMVWTKDIFVCTRVRVAIAKLPIGVDEVDKT